MSSPRCPIEYALQITIIFLEVEGKVANLEVLTSNHRIIIPFAQAELISAVCAALSESSGNAAVFAMRRSEGRGKFELLIDKGTKLNFGRRRLESIRQRVRMLEYSI